MVMCFACRHYSEKHECRFFVFPKIQDELAKWLKLVRREDKVLGKYSRICSCHFVNKDRKNGPTIFDYDPEIKKKGSDIGREYILCVICQKKFLNQAELSRHIMIHAGKVWYKCMQCSKCFSTKGRFNSHIKRHRTQDKKSQGITGGVYLEIKVHECERSSSDKRNLENDVMKEQPLTEFNEEEEETFNEQIKMEILENLISPDIKTESTINSAEYNLEPTDSYDNIYDYIKTEIDVEDIKKEDSLS